MLSTMQRSRSSALSRFLAGRAALIPAYLAACLLRSRRRFLAEPDSPVGVLSCTKRTGERAVPPDVDVRSSVQSLGVRLGVRGAAGGLAAWLFNIYPLLQRVHASHVCEKKKI